MLSDWGGGGVIRYVSLLFVSYTCLYHHAYHHATIHVYHVCIVYPCAKLEHLSNKDGRKNTPLLCLTLAMASLGVSWAGRLRVRHSHGGLASGRASETRGCPLAGRDLHGNPLHTDLCFWRLLLALCAIATPEAVLGECVAVLLRQWIEPRRRLHR